MCFAAAIFIIKHYTVCFLIKSVEFYMLLKFSISINHGVQFIQVFFFNFILLNERKKEVNLIVTT